MGKRGERDLYDARGRDGGEGSQELRIEVDRRCGWGE
jgi:hypothetical protein